MSDQDYTEFKEPKPLPPRSPMRSPRARSPFPSGSPDESVSSEGRGGRRTSTDVDPSRSSRVGNIILQAAHQAQQQEHAHASARSAAQIAAQARKMRSRTKRVAPVGGSTDSDLYNMEAGVRGTPGGPPVMVSEFPEQDMEYSQAETASPTAKDIRGQNIFTHDGKAYNVPLPPAFALLDIGKPGRRLGQRGALFSGPIGYRICLWLAVVSMVLSFLLGVSLLVAYLTLDPKEPSFELDEIRVQWWSTYKDTKGEFSESIVNGTAVPTVYLYADAILVTKAGNPNKKISLHYSNITFEVSYQGQRIGSATVEPLIQPPNDNREVTVEWKCDACAVLNVGHYLEADEQMGAVPLQIKLTVNAQVEVGGVVSPGYPYSTVYDVRVRPPQENSSRR